MKKKKSIIATLALLLTVIYAGCKMDVNEAIRPIIFVEPYISTQPASVSYYPGEYTAPPTLTVESEGWSDEDGSLTYQWYTFPNIGAYLNGQAQAIDGATTNTYTPPALAATTPGSRNYFYVVLTNENSRAVDKKSGSLRSNVAIISFNDTGRASIPLLAEQPIDGQARFATTLNPFVVQADSARLADDKMTGTREVFYQWYRVIRNGAGSFDVDANGLPTSVLKLDGEIGSWYAPDMATLTLGDHFFYVVVTHSVGHASVDIDADGNVTINGGQQQTETSVPTKVTVLPGLRAATPVIVVQPKPALYFTGEPVKALTVVATAVGGTTSYQWYSNDELATTKGNRTAIPGATGNSYTPNDPNVKFFYVEVTNNVPPENVVAGGETTATVTSRAVNVRQNVTAGTTVGNAVVTLDPTKKFQYIRGYGGMEVAWANFPETFPEDTELMYNPDRLGYNILRIMLPLFDVNIDKSMEQMIRERRKHYYDNVKIVNKYGGYVAAAPWSPPKEWKSNNSINGGGNLIHEYYKQYAAYLRSFSQHMYNHGAPIYCISIQNEPNYTAGYDGCEWTPNEMRDFFIQVGRFTEGVRGYGGGKPIPTVLTMNGESANNPAINQAAIDAPDAYKHIDVFARHVYGERRKNLWGSAPDWPLSQARPFVQQVDKKDVWMTEHNINSANATAYPNDSTWNYIWRFMNDIDLVMRLNNENAFVWWASKRFYSMVGDGQFATPAGEALARGWGLSHYSKYTIDTHRIGFTLTGTTATPSQQINYQVMTDNTNRDADENAVVNGAAGDMDNVTARITAYAKFNADDTLGDEISLVMWTPTDTAGGSGINMGRIQIGVPQGFKIGSATGVRSRSTDGLRTNVYHENVDVDVSVNRDIAYVDLPSSQIVSIKLTRAEE